jgi:hypothetical protein
MGEQINGGLVNSTGLSSSVLDAANVAEAEMTSQICTAIRLFQPQKTFFICVQTFFFSKKQQAYAELL